MKIIIGILVAAALGLVTNLVSSFLVPKAEKRQKLFCGAFTALIGLLIVLAFIPDTPTPPTSYREVKDIVDRFEKSHERELSAYQGQVKALTEAVTALTQQEGPDVDKAMAQLRQGGNTEAAETIFENVLKRKVAEGQAAYRQAAKAAKHLGALAFFRDTQKALAAYRYAVALDPADANVWSQLGQLLYRIGQLDEAVEAFNQIQALGTNNGNQELLATAYNNLGILYGARGDLAQAKAMFHQALELGEALGHKEGMATVYNNLGIVYRIQGDLKQAEDMHRQALALHKGAGNEDDMARHYGNLGIVYHDQGDLKQAEAMYRQALALNKEVGNKEGVANQYGNLGIVYRDQGDLKQAEDMHRQALRLFEEIGATPKIEKARASLDKMRMQDAP
jgi:tetratricopeptide (TPR) repeat protein